MSERAKATTSVSLLFRLTDATDGSAVAGVDYYRLKYVDSAGSPATVYSNEIPAMLYGGGGMGGFTNTFGGGFLS